MGDDPRVTVLMPARNAGAFLPASLESIFVQTYRNFEIVVVDDASGDETADILAGAPDQRLRVLRLERRSGVAAALNAGLGLARGRYVARMDADDIAMPDRLERELELLERDRSIGIVGGNLQPIDVQGRPLGAPTNVPTSPGHVRWMLHVHNCVNHPTVVARRDVLQDLGGYRSDAEPAEDYDLWVRAIDVTRIANIPDVVVRYRQHEGGSSTANAADATGSADAIAVSALTRLFGRAPHPDVVRALRGVGRHEPASADQFRAASVLLWRFTGAILADPSLTRGERASIRRDALGWFGDLVRTVARHDRVAAASLVLPHRGGPPAWAFASGAATAGRRAVRALARS